MVLKVALDVRGMLEAKKCVWGHIKNLRDDFDSILEFPHILFFALKAAYIIGNFECKKENVEIQELNQNRP